MAKGLSKDELGCKAEAIILGVKPRPKPRRSRRTEIGSGRLFLDLKVLGWVNVGLNLLEC